MLYRSLFWPGILAALLTWPRRTSHKTLRTQDHHGRQILRKVLHQAQSLGWLYGHLPIF
jgi:hypothetical protein